MPQQPYYDETPFERIVDVHWRKKDPCPPPRAARAHYSGFYGYGLTVPGRGETIVPYGEHQYPGCVGWSDFRAPNIISGHDYGGIYTYNYIPTSWTEGADLTGSAYTANLLLLLGSITFTNNELWYGPFDEPPQPILPAIAWTVPMSGGESYLGCFGTQNIFAPWVPLVYRLTFNWNYAGQGLPLGLSFTPIGMGWPAEPQFTIGETGGAGFFSYGYETHYWDWFVEDFTHGHHYDQPEDWEFKIGGPVQLFWHTRTNEGWRTHASAVVLEMGLSVPGDFQTWEVVAECGLAFTAADIGIAPTPPPPAPTPPTLLTNDRRLVRPGPPLCGDTSLVYPPLDPKMLECILALERAREAPMLVGSGSAAARAARAPFR